VAGKIIFRKTEAGPGSQQKYRNFYLRKLDNYKTPGLDHFMKQKRKLTRLWQKARDPKCKTAINWVA
jgi:hypothetical protein